MNALELMRYLQHPESLTAQSVRDLDVLVEDFPYFHAARLAHVKALQNAGNYRQSEYLSKAAAYLPDRTVLKAWLEGTEEEAIPLQFLHHEKSMAVAPTEPEVEEAPPVAPPVEEQVAVEDEAETVEEPAEEILEPVEEPARPPVQATFPDPVQTPQDEDWDSLDPVAKARRILEKNRAIRAALEGKSISANTPTPAPPAPVVESAPIPDPIPVSVAKPKAPEPGAAEPADLPLAVEQPTNKPALEPTLKTSEATQGKMTFSEWLQLSKAKENAEAMAAPVLPSVEVQPAQEASPVVSKEELIDRFLQSQPKIQPKKEPVAPPHVPMPTSGGMLVTETLAKLYADQGHLQLAEEAYEILKLKYPEKSSFFAARIREIKALQKN